MKLRVKDDHCHSRQMFAQTCATLLLTYYYRLALSRALQLPRDSLVCNVALPLHQYMIGLIKAHAFITINTTSRFTGTLINSGRGEIYKIVYILAVDIMPASNKFSDKINLIYYTMMSYY